MSPLEERARAVAFLRAFSLRLARRVEELPWGMAVFDPTLPLVWHLNSVWMDTVPEGITGTMFAAELERIQSATGLDHRRAIVADEEGGARLARELPSLGWSTERNVLMAHRRAADRASDLSQVREIDGSLAGAFTERSLRSSGATFSQEVIQQLVLVKTLLADTGARFFGAFAGSLLVSSCELYVDGRTAQIESVTTLPDYRGRGFARAVVGRALAEGYRAGSDLVFLEAEEDDWPKHLYAKLGFDPIGHTHVFTRTPSIAGASPQRTAYGSRSTRAQPLSRAAIDRGRLSMVEGLPKVPPQPQASEDDAS